MTFAAQLAHYKQLIDADIAAYSTHVQKVTRSQYGEHPAVVTDQYLDLLQRGGKRIRGALVMTGYEMLGGTNAKMIVRAATAIEMVHAAVLIIDDIQDGDTVRRGKPAVHTALTDYHRQLKLQGDATQAGIGLALNASLGALHAAQVLFAGLDADPELRLKVIGIVNQTIITTLHGQTHDVINAGLTSPDPASIEQAREWKSAHYTFLNPLCVGMVLANAGCEDTDAIREYALHTGMAFQLADDLMDGDIPKAKIAAARAQATEHARRAVRSLQANHRPWRADNVAFLRDLAQYVVEREA